MSNMVYEIRLQFGSSERHFLTCETEKEAIEICEAYDYVFVDECDFSWDMYYEAIPEEQDRNDFMEWLTDGKQGGAAKLLQAYQKA